MSQDYNRPFQGGNFQEPAESLHWISFNLKAIAKELASITQLLSSMQMTKEASNLPRSSEIPF